MANNFVLSTEGPFSGIIGRKEGLNRYKTLCHKACEKLVHAGHNCSTIKHAV